jgi:TRAP transporter 4TM/12TM fusion protein
MKKENREELIESTIKKYDRSERTRDLTGLLKILLTFIAVGMSLYHLYTARYGTPIAIIHRSIHVSFILVMVFLLYPPFRKNNVLFRIIDGILIILSIIPSCYLITQYKEIVLRAGMPNKTDLILAGLIILLVLEAARRVMGWVLPALSILFLLYGYYGSYFIGRLSHRGFSFDEIFEYMYLTTEGIYGVPIGVSAQYLILFILFGAFLLKSGVGDFFNDLAIAIAGQSKGGPAQVAVISSGFMGSINGSAVANVVTTGTFTIPLMKRIGYSPEFAGGVEAAASCGGQILPPVMGAAAFIMAETLGIKYVNIMYAAIIPALLYYGSALTMVYLRASHRNLRGLDQSEVPNLWVLIKKKFYLFTPMVVLVYLLVRGYTPTYAAFFAIITSVLVSWIKPETRMTPKKIIEALEMGARNTISVAVPCAVVGIIVGISTLTGFGSKIAGSIISWSGGSLFLTLFFTMIACIVLGLGMPSIPAYILTATMAAPALARMGVPPLASHFFVFYFAMMANVTPPVALAAFAASGISGGDINKTGYEAFKLALAGFLIPYMFVYSPALLGIETTFGGILVVAITAMIGVIALAGAVEGYLLIEAKLYQRLILLAAAFTLIKPGGMTDIIGFLLIGIVIVFQLVTKRSSNKSNSL